MRRPALVPLAILAPVILAPVILILAACQQAEPPAPAVEAAPRPGVESTATGIRLATLPAGVDVASDGADGLRLSVAAADGSSDAMTVTLSDEYPTGLNIVDAVKAEMAAFEARPEGRSFGKTEMIAPIGLTYMLRGRYLAGGSEVEELRALVAHPWGNRLLILSYVYPAGDDTSERGGRLMEVLGEIEPLDEPALLEDPAPPAD